MDTFERFKELMATLDAGRRDALQSAASRLLGSRKDVSGSGDVVAGEHLPPEQVADALDRVMDLVEADLCLEQELPGQLMEVQDSGDSSATAERVLVELEKWVHLNARLTRPATLWSARTRMVRRLNAIAPRLDVFGQDGLFDAASRLTRSWRGGWADLRPDERSVGVWRIVSQLNRQLDAAELALAECASPAPESGGDISEAAAIEIATLTRGPLPDDLPEDWGRARKVTEEPPPGLYRTWPDEPAWYVWFLPRFFGLGSSHVIAVSKRTGRVLGSGSAGDEG